MTLDYYMGLIDLATSCWDVWEIVAIADEDDAFSDDDAIRLDNYAEETAEWLERLND